MTPRQEDPLTSTHWGTYRVQTKGGKVTALNGFEADPDPSPIGNGIVDVLDGPTRIKSPMVRMSWLRGGAGSATHLRGDDTFVPVSWDKAETLVAAELDRVRCGFRNQAIYGGSYGWGSAGRFHHAQSQLHLFLNCIGGYTCSVNTYSQAAGEVILSHVLGDFNGLIQKQTSWQSIIDATQLLVGFGGVPSCNAQISAGGTGRHRTREALMQARAAGVDFVNISPLRGDMDTELGADWLAPRPGSDVALMLGLAHTLLVENLHDRAFLERYTTGFDRFAGYLMGASDGTEKTASWAASISGLSARAIRNLARRMVRGRTMISVNWALTRQEYGEQPFWAGTALAAMIGQIGLPGGGIAYGYGAANSIGLETRDVRYKALPQGNIPIAEFIPAARISDMLLNPGAPFEYNGQTAHYPDIKLVYWAGGNPFHHHQDLARLKRAWQKPDTVIVYEWCWNALAKPAGIVLPCTTGLERRDLMLTPRDPYIVAMQQVIVPVGEARNDFDIFAGISGKTGVQQAFTEELTAEEWQRWIYDQSRQSAAESGVTLPSLKALRDTGWHRVDPPEQPHVMLTEFRSDPEAKPLHTPSGKIEIFSQTIAGFGCEDCPGHPVWQEPVEWLGRSDKTHPLHLISNQPKHKLHSQLDHGAVSRAAKINGYEPLRMHPENAAECGIPAGDLLRVFNDRGACLAVAVLSDDIRLDVVQISTGAWLDPEWQSDGSLLCRHGNPNVLTHDKGTSRLAQGPTAHSCLIDVERYKSAPPTIRAFDPPRISDG